MPLPFQFFTYISKGRTHDDSFVPKLFVIIVNFSDRKYSRVFLSGVRLFIGVCDIPIQNTTDKRRY